jgi:hypothetical protein
MIINFERLMKILSITKKRISAIIFAIILLLTTAMIPPMKVEAWDLNVGNLSHGLAVMTEVTVTTNEYGIVDVTFTGPAPFSNIDFDSDSVTMVDNTVTGNVTFDATDSSVPEFPVNELITGSFSVTFSSWSPVAGSGTFTFTETGIVVNIGSITATADTYPTYTVTDLRITAYPQCTIKYYINEVLVETQYSDTSDGRITDFIPTLAEYEELIGWYPSQELLDLGIPPIHDVNDKSAPSYITNWNHVNDVSFYGKTVFRYPVTVAGGTADFAKAEAGTPVTLTPTVPSGKEFIGWTSSPEVAITNNSFTMPANPVTITANFRDVAPPSNSGSSSNMDYPTIPVVTKPDAEASGTTPAATPETATPTTPAATPAADVKVDETPAEDGKITVTVGDKAIETSSTSAATAIAAGEASEVITSGNAVAVVTTDGAVIAGANASGSLNSASTIAALTSAATSAAEGDTVVVAAGNDVTSISAATIRKLAAAAEAAGVKASLTAAATDESGEEIATIDIPLSDKTKTSIKTGLILVDESIDKAVAEREKLSGVTVLASLKTEQKTSFGTKVTFSFATETLGLDDAKDGDTYYVAILRGDGKTVQVPATIVDGKLVYTTASAGVMMISNEKFTK